MNEDYAHLLPGGQLDFSRLAAVLAAIAGRPDNSLRKISRDSGLNEITVRRASRGHKISAESYLKLCLVLDYDPFDGLRVSQDVSCEHTTVAPEASACLEREARADG